MKFLREFYFRVVLLREYNQLKVREYKIALKKCKFSMRKNKVARFLKDIF